MFLLILFFFLSCTCILSWSLHYAVFKERDLYFIEINNFETSEVDDYLIFFEKCILFCVQVYCSPALMLFLVFKWYSDGNIQERKMLTILPEGWEILQGLCAFPWSKTDLFYWHKMMATCILGWVLFAAASMIDYCVPAVSQCWCQKILISSVKQGMLLGYWFLTWGTICILNNAMT